MHKLVQWFGTSQKPNYGRIWLLFFIYPAILALLVQLVILPYIVPTWNAGNGMLVGGDSIWYHRLATEMAQNIHVQGWSAWALRPIGQAPAGIAAAIYALTISEPWMLIPLNAALHATSAMILLLMIQKFLPEWRKAIWTVLPFWLYPSAMIWYAQIHKDGLFIAGMLLYLFGWVLLSQNQTWEKTWWRGLLAAIWILLGAGLVWVARPYGVQMMQGVGIALALILTIIFMFRLVKKNLKWFRALMPIVISWAILIVMVPLTRGGGIIEAEVPVTIQPAAQPAQPAQPAQQPAQPAQPAQLPWYSRLLQLFQHTTVTARWQSTGWPDFIENKAYTLSLVRDGYVLSYTAAGSNIDVTVQFHSVPEVLAYLPRATEIAFLSPFPNTWLGQGSLPATTVMRRISGFEMIGIYIGLALMPLAVWQWRRKPEFWMVLTFCSGMLLIYALVVANVGTLYRFRYGFIMTLVAMGIAGGLSFWERRRKQAKV